MSDMNNFSPQNVNFKLCFCLMKWIYTLKVLIHIKKIDKFYTHIFPWKANKSQRQSKISYCAPLDKYMVKFNSIIYTQILSSAKTNPVPPGTSLPGLPVVSLIFLFLLCCFSLFLLTEKIIKELITSILTVKEKYFYFSEMTSYYVHVWK